MRQLKNSAPQAEHRWPKRQQKTVRPKKTWIIHGLALTPCEMPILTGDPEAALLWEV
jgi:hypothetical protein